MKSILRVMIENFQSHRNTELELAPGFNVIVGPSDQGKTAILRAIRWVLYNDPRGTDFIRVGASKAKVTLVMNDGTLVTRERGSSRNRYSIAKPGEEEQWYEGFGQSVPEEVMEATGVRPVKIDEDYQVAIHLGMQLAPPFLLDNNGAIKAKAIGRMNGVHILDYAHKTTSSELNSKVIEERRIQSEYERVNEQLQQYNDLDEWQQKLEKIEGHFAKVKEFELKIEWFVQKSQQRVELSKKLQLADQYLNSLSALNEAGEKWSQAQAVQQKWVTLTELQKKLHTSQAALVDVNAVIQHTQALEKTSPLLREVERKSILLESLEKVADQRDRVEKERAQIQLIIEQTQGIERGEQQFYTLQESAIKEEQLVSLQRKQQEYQGLRRKIDHVLVKTSHILLAEQQWDQWRSKELILEGLLAYQRRLRDTQGQVAKVNLFLHRTVQLHSTEAIWKKVEGIMEQERQLELYDLKVKEIHQEKIELQLKTKEIEEGLEFSAKQYYQELKKIGRCPVCLGEIESHTVQRIVAEMNG